MTYDFLKSLYDDIMSLAKEIVVKRDDLAIANGSIDTIKEYEEYRACVKGERNIFNFLSLNREILASHLPPAIVGTCMRDRKKIPSEYLDDIITDMMAYVIDNYEEHNDYYRMLAGIPAMDDHEYIYITGWNNISNRIPIHQMSVDDIAFIESKGVLSKLQKKYPDKQYLRFLGVHRIDLIEAHEAKPFQLLRLGGCENRFVEKFFRSEYHKARRYVMIELYNKHMFIDRPLYEPMMAVLILCLAIRNTLVPTEDMYLNFEEILDAILESYGILQYFERLPFTYKKKLVLMLDKLYQNKGTDGVLVDICKLFSNDNMVAKRYYLLKTNAQDMNGNPIISDNPNTQYQLKFLTVDIESRDITVQEKNIIDYESIVDNDYLWQMSGDETAALKAEEFNIWMSKYISAQAAYDLAQLTYEVCFFINLLLSARNNMSRIRVNNMYAKDGECDCFTMVVFMLALMARRAEYDGNIIYKPDEMATIWRFNLEADPIDIKEIIDKYNLPDELRYIFFDERGYYRMESPTGQNNDNDIINIYINNRDIFDSLQEAALHTTDIDHYTALMQIKNILFHSALMKSSFTKSNGEVANTYVDMLNDLDENLYDVVMKSSDDELNSATLYVMEKMEYVYSYDVLRFVFINTPNTSIAAISKYIRTAIEVFKASSVQLDNINVFFYLGTDSPIRVFDRVGAEEKRGVTDQVNIKDEIGFRYRLILEDYVRIQDKTYTSVE